MRIIIASILILAINGAAFVPGLEQLRPWIPIISAVIGLYLLIQGFFLLNKSSAASPPSPAPTPAAPEVKPKERDREIDAHLVQFLGRLQEKGRFVDFVMDDITSYSNEQVGAAARVVHQGCSQVVKEHLTIAPVHAGQEGSQVTLEKGYDATSYRAVGKLAGSPPFSGALLHHGWKATRIELPRLAEKPATSGDLIVTPAEVEVKS